ncbi:MAG: pilin [bacterium]
MRKVLKHVLAFSIISMLVMPMLSVSVSAQEFGLNYASNLELGGENSDPRDVAVNIIKIIMTFLGIVAVVIILYGGFLWMTAAGNEDRSTKAKDLIIAGVIGMVIIMAAFMIVSWVFRQSGNLINP